MTINSSALDVGRKDLSRTRWADETLTAGGNGAVLAIRHFALTANNITYAVYGEDMSYWGFFPAGEGFGRIPVWGFADVVETAVAEVPVGARYYGYFPMASHVRVEPAKASARGFIDGAAHRRALPAVYNTYERVTAVAADAEAIRMLLQPLVITSFLIADFLDDNGFFGARHVVISSASSKTSLGLGLCLKQLARQGVTTIGLTSAGNRAFVEGSGAYGRVVSYDDIATLDPDVPTVYVDMAGSADLLSKVHHHFRDRLVHSCRVGATHWEDKAGRMDLPGARPLFFFAPSRIEKRNADWGAGGVMQKFGTAWGPLAEAGRRWLTIEHRQGRAAVEAAYRETLGGRTAPSVGLVLSV